MKGPPLRVAFLWHMHQPYYKNPRTALYTLPWVRLHAVKDYHDMVARLEEYPGIKANFNLVPCLVEQILDYSEGKVRELHLELSRKPAAELDEGEKVTLLRHFFLGNRATMIEPYPRYRSLLEKCKRLDSEYKVEAAVRRLRHQDLLDLQVWSNLAWMGPVTAKDPEVASLLHEGRHFDEGMKQMLLAKQQEVICKTLDKYRDLSRRGQIEISTSPYFHPIVPLLCDSEVASRALPGISLPRKRIRFGDDARQQILSGIDLHSRVFGEAPNGMWPPEGGVSNETVELAGELGVKWMATDESILGASLGVQIRNPVSGRLRRPDLLYKPHVCSYDGGEVAVFFRDRVLSDLMSFGYTDLPARDAVKDFMTRLHRIGKDLGEDVSESVVVVALDGENCWEFYDRGGDPFLRELYKELDADPEVETVRLSDALEEMRRMPGLKDIYPGSWIGRNFGTWIGNAEDNKAWDLLYDARVKLQAEGEKLTAAERETAWRCIYAAEGSDWFWWYGGERLTHEDTEFDALFRAHIRHVYELLDSHVPHAVLKPVMAKRRGVAISFEPAAVIKPILDGRVTSFYEWKLAGLYESYRDSSRRISGSRILDAVYFGFDHETLYLRLDTSVSPQAEEFCDFQIQIEVEDPAHANFILAASRPCSPGTHDLAVSPKKTAKQIEATALEIVEVAIPFENISAKAGDVVAFRLAIVKDGEVIEHRPVHEFISFTIPTPDFEAEMWSTL
jgi:alpha-amylase/alpha-mannosidase (GH57 family)